MDLLDSLVSRYCRDQLEIQRDPKRLLMYPIFKHGDGLRVLRLSPEPGNCPLITWKRAGGIYGSTNYIVRYDITPMDAVWLCVNSVLCEPPDQPIRALDDWYWWPLWNIIEGKTLTKVVNAYSTSGDPDKALESWRYY